MKKIAKITGVILTLLMILSAVAIPVSAVGESYLTINNYGDFAVVTKCLETASGTVDIPSIYDGVAVTKIAGNAFSGCKGITQVNIPESITYLGSNAFNNCSALKTVSFKGADCVIDSAAFSGCSSLQNITLPLSLKEIPDSAFKGCVSLTEIEIPETVTLIGESAFASCSSIIGFDIPASVNVIRKNAFMGCKNVASYNVASGNSVYSSADGVLYGPYESPYDDTMLSPVTDKALIAYPRAITSSAYTVASGTKIISEYAFGENASLTKIALPSGLEMIDTYAFYLCKNLSDITIPSTVTEIGSQAFGRCESLKSITIPASVKNFESAFYKSGLETATIENGVETIGTKSFEDCTSLVSVNIPESVKTISVGAFYGCTALETLSVPSSVTKIGNGAFGKCDSLTLKVESGSAAHTYAVNNSIDFELTGSDIVSPEKNIVSISVQTLPNKTSYYYKQSLDTTGLKLTVNYSDGSSETVSSGFTVSPSGIFTKTGNHTITVDYEGFTASFNVSVSYAWWQMIIMIILLGFLWY